MGKTRNSAEIKDVARLVLTLSIGVLAGTGKLPRSCFYSSGEETAQSPGRFEPSFQPPLGSLHRQCFATGGAEPWPLNSNVMGSVVGEKQIGGGIREAPSQWPIIGGLPMIVYRLWQDVPYLPLGPTRKQKPLFCDPGSREQRRWRGQAKERCVGGAEPSCGLGSAGVACSRCARCRLRVAVHQRISERTPSTLMLRCAR
ncbi:hypothetical protein BHE74_00007814 [Ensete ventricosum]|nr:hypothetical protein GW17_00004696 [Ensete ventricosum]RWW83669.1 hypothetical protein BHE74_00007814 [Ensete ventricosum]